MKIRSFALFIALPLAMALTTAGCSRQESQDKAAVVAPAQSFEAAAGAKGFTVGAMMSANTAYVMFDPQCPHCGHLWQASLPLHKAMKFVWIPVAFINAKSTPQGAALLSAANPTALMSEHEASLLAGAGGISASASISSELESAIKANTKLFNSMGVASVPYIIAKNARTGQVVTQTGAMTTAALANFLGMAQP